MAQRLARVPLASFQPFTLVVVQPQCPTGVYHWNGASLQSAVAVQPLLTSSSFDTARVIAQRQASFTTLQSRAGETRAATLQRFHRSHAPLAPGAAVCLHRAEAETVSFSHIAVTPARITFRYTPQAPCGAPEHIANAISLARVTS